MKTQTKLALGVLTGALVTCAAWSAMTAHWNLVTLNVRNMEVREVVKKLERQTWESISVDENVQGKVTLKLRRVPLEEVLRIVGDQTSSRWGVIYPLYTSSRSLARLKRGLRGEIDPAVNGWTNLQSRASFRGGPMFAGMGGPFGGPGAGPEASAKQRVSLQMSGKDLSFATLAFNRFAQARVVPEDGTTGPVTMMVSQATLAKAVGVLARETHRNWAKLYTLQAEGGPGGPGGGPGGPFQFAMRDPGQGSRRGSNEMTNTPALATPNPNGVTNSFTNAQPPGPFGGRRNELTQAQREEMRRQREGLEEELRQVLPVAERQRLEQEQQQREQQFRELENLTPEQRQQRFAQMGRGGGMDRRNLDRIRNTTPEQRAEQFRRMAAMRQRFQQQPPPSGGPQPPPR